jgi:hypothetical protein
MMNPSPDQPHAVRRVVLPSGKTIDVVYFADGESSAPAPSLPRAQATGPQAPARQTDDLHRCRECASELVYPTHWDEAGPERWELALRCPNCEWRGEGTYDQETVEHLDEALDRGTHALLSDLKQLVHANMEDEIERFVSALHADHIVPMDF